jgi:hypothetical protein
VERDDRRNGDRAQPVDVGAIRSERHFPRLASAFERTFAASSKAASPPMTKERL